MMPWSPAPSSLLAPGWQRVDALRDIGRLRMQQDFDVAGVPVEARLLIADVLDSVANHALDLIEGHGRGAAGLPAITTLLVVASVSQAARIAQGSMPALGPSRKTDRRSRRRSGRTPCPDDLRKPIHW